MDIRRNANPVESQEPRRGLRPEREVYAEVDVPDEVEAWDLDDMDMMDIVPDAYE